MKLKTVEDLREFLEKFLKEKNIRARVILFGSRARGNFESYSDVDIAIESDEDLWDFLVELKGILEESDLPQKVDVVELSKVPEDLRRNILREGKIWIDTKNP